MSFLVYAMPLTGCSSSLSGRPEISHRRLTCVDSSAPAVPVLGSPVAPVDAGVEDAENSYGLADLSFSMSSS